MIKQNNRSWRWHVNRIFKVKILNLSNFLGRDKAMVEKLSYDLNHESVIDKVIDSVRANRLNVDIKNNADFTMMDLVSVFEDEAVKVCSNKRIAHLIALEAINDYVEGHVDNIKIS